MLTLEQLIEAKKELAKGWLKTISKAKSEKEVDYLIADLHDFHFNLAVKQINDRDFYSAKTNFNISSLIDCLVIGRYNHRIFDYGLNHIFHPLLSDNEDTIKAFSKLRYNRDEDTEYSMDEMVLMGENPIWINTIQMFICYDKEGIERNLNIIETKVLKRLKKNEKALEEDYHFYRSLYSGNKSKMEEVLEKLANPKMAKRRSGDLLSGNYISMPATGYAKLAWRNGFKVEVRSNLVIKELLPIEPLDKYEIPYNFLKFKI